MSVRQWAYVGSVSLVGIGFTMIVAPLTVLSSEQLLIFVVLTILATLAQFIEFPFADNSQAYYPHMVFFFAGVLLLSPLLFVFLVTIPHVVEMLKMYIELKKLSFSWYVQMFNIAVHIIAGIVAHWFYLTLNANVSEMVQIGSVLAVTVAAISYVIVNHLLVGLAMVIVNKMSWRESGVLAWENLLTDFILLYMGYAVAVLWGINPWLLMPALSPLVLMYRALLVPKLTQEAQTDSKTGLLNARYFNQRFSEELENARQLQQPLTLIMADLDLLRMINNTYGHLGGDAVLAGVGKLIQECTRADELAGRFGGEEFAIILPGTDQEEARALAERIRAKIEATCFELVTSPTPIRATMSFGIACFPADADILTNLIYQADIAVYHAKLSGRNRVMCLADLPQAVRFEGIPTADLSLLTAETTTRVPAGSERVRTEPRTSALNGFHGQNLLIASPLEIGGDFLRRAFMSSVIVLGAVVTLGGFSITGSLSWFTVGLLVCMAVIAELLQIDLYRIGTISASVAISFAAALLIGIPGVVFVSAAIAVTTAIAHSRNQSLKAVLFKTAFNWSTHVLAGAIPAIIMRALGLSLHIADLPVLVASMIVAAVAYFIVESILVATVIAVSMRAPVMRTWTIQFRWLAGHYLVLCIMGLFFSLAYVAFGWPGMIVFVLPILMMRYSQMQYVEQTEGSIRELKRLNQELARANQETISANNTVQQLNNELFSTLAQIIDARDPYVSCHAAKVADYAVVVAKEMKLPTERVDQIRQASLLHDIGKIAISEQVLQKKERLTEAEFEYVKTHAAIGAVFLETSHGLRHLARFVRHHHERWDGRGYPDKLRGEEIPFEARIIAICDSVEVMASDRPYRRAHSLHEIIAELRRMSGTQFDPMITEIFVHVLEREGDRLIVNSAHNAALHALRWRLDWPQTDEVLNDEVLNSANADITKIFTAPTLQQASKVS